MSVSKDEVEAACVEFNIAKTNWFDRGRMHAALRAAASIRDGGEEPVAWRWRAKVKGEWGLWSVVEVDPNDWTWREYWEEMEAVPLRAAAKVRAIREGDGEVVRTLPCDVRLPPATVIGEGASLSALIKALEVRGMRQAAHDNHFRDALQRIADQPEEFRSKNRSYGVGYAFHIVKNIANNALAASPAATGGEKE